MLLLLSVLLTSSQWCVGSASPSAVPHSPAPLSRRSPSEGEHVRLQWRAWGRCGVRRSAVSRRTMSHCDADTGRLVPMAATWQAAAEASSARIDAMAPPLAATTGPTRRWHPSRTQGTTTRSSILLSKPSHHPLASLVAHAHDLHRAGATYVANATGSCIRHCRAWLDGRACLSPSGQAYLCGACHGLLWLRLPIVIVVVVTSHSLGRACCCRCRRRMLQCPSSDLQQHAASAVHSTRRPASIALPALQ